MLGVAYKGYKQFEVYSLVIGRGGSKKLFYTINRGGSPMEVDLTKVSAMIATCE